MKKTIISIILSTCFVASLKASEVDRDLLRRIINLGWEGVGSYTFSHSKASIDLPEGYYILCGDKANQALDFFNLPFKKNREAIIISSTDNFESAIDFATLPGLHVNTSGWSKIDSDLLLGTIRNTNAHANEERKAQGLEELQLIGWQHKPSFDQPNNTIYGATIWNSKGEGLFVIEWAIKLGRDSTLLAKWTHRGEYYSNELNILLKLHKFLPGSNYEDYCWLDQTATCEIKGLLDLAWGVANDKAKDSFQPPISIPTLIILVLYWICLLLAAFFSFKARQKEIWSGNERIASDMFWCFSLLLVQQFTDKQLLTKEVPQAFFSSFGMVATLFFMFFFWSWTRDYAKCRFARAIINLLFTCSMLLFLIYFGCAIFIIYSQPTFLTIFITLGIATFLLIFMLKIIRKYKQIMARNSP